MRTETMDDSSWNVLVHDINHGRIEEYDVVPAFEAWLDDLRPKDRPKTREAFDEELEHCARYRFWAKCEYEVLVGGLFSKADPEKTDVYRQLKLNWGPFCSFMWERRQRKGRK